VLVEHCSDASLMAHLDGELPLYSRGVVRRHIGRCWQCRLRLAELEAQLLVVTRAIREDVPVLPHRVVGAKLKFLARADAIADEVLRTGARGAPDRSRRLACAAASVLVVFVCLWWAGRSHFTTPAQLSARQIMRQIENAEMTPSHAGPVAQEFQVTVRRVRPAPVAHQRRLGIRFDPERRRFTARLDDSGGVLRYAVWQPAPDRRFLYDPSNSSHPVALARNAAPSSWTKVLFRGDLDLPDLERALLSWLVSRDWAPIALSTEVAVFAASDAAVLRAERFECGDGRPCIRLSARKTIGNVTIEFAVEAEESSRKPRVQYIRYENPERALELRIHPLPVQDALALPFDPPEPVLLRAASPAASSLRPAPPKAVEVPLPDLVALEVEVYYALHRARACVGEPLEVVREAGELVVRGIVGSPERKHELQGVLTPLAGRFLRVELQAASEVFPDISGKAISLAESPLTDKAIANPFARYFHGNHRAAEKFADLLISRGEDLAKEAQALRDIARRFGAGSSSLAPRARALVGMMVREHLNEIRNKAEITGVLLEAVIAPREAPAGLRGSPALDARWDEEVSGIFDDGTRLEGHLRDLSRSATPDSIGELARTLLDELAAIRSRAGHALAAANIAFQGPR